MALDVDRDRQVEELFADALDVLEEERRAWLENACRGDLELLAEVRSLLRAYDRAPELIDRSILPGWTESIVDSDPDVMAGRELGPWRIVEHIATGGMAAVYLGERIDESFRMKVAIKILAAGAFHPGLLSRFRMERQVLADLDHPGIARLLDGGTTDDGLPYLVMEFVEGTSLRDAVRQRGLSVLDRLRLFLEVAEAVQYAHSNLVIHRDLKPGNILVRADGHVKLLDFGIAKVFQADSGAETAMGTAWALTPRYASPEQIDGKRVTTATDIYSLGVVLYELLTGRLPYELDRGSVIEIGRVICDTPPTPPSRLRDLPEAHRFAGDLDTILLKALAKEPNRRYSSVADLADDVRRHLNGEPVLARGDSTGYRLSRFARRNKSLVAGIFAVFLILVTALAVTLSFYRRAVDSAAAARRSNYASSMAATEAAIMNHNIPEARAILDATDTEHRGWEYRHLAARLDRSASSWKAHRDGIAALDISPDGSQLVTAGDDSTARLWALETRNSLAMWSFGETPESCRLLADGRIAVGLNRGTVVTAAIGEEPELLGRGSYWAIIDVDPTGYIVAAGFENGEVALFDARNRRELRRWKAHFRLTAPAFSPDGMDLATAGSDSVVRIWSLSDGRLKRTLRGHRRRVYNLAYSQDGRRLVSGSSDHTVTVWDLETGLALSSFSEHRGIPSKLAFHPNGRSVLTAGTEGRVMVWDAATGGREAEYHGHRGDVMSVGISPDGRTAVTGEFDGTVRTWRWGTDDVRVFRSTEFGSYSADVFTLPDLDVDPSGRYLATFNGLSFPEGRVLMIRDTLGRSTVHLNTMPYMSALAFEDSATILRATERGVIERLKLTETRLCEPDSIVVDRPVFSLAIDRQHGVLASGEDDGVISLFRLPSRERLRSWKSDLAAIRVLEFNAPGTVLASADSAGGVRLWDATTGDLLGGLSSLESRVMDLAFHPRDPVLIIATEAGAALLWSFELGGACDTLHANGSGVASVLFDREGRRIVLGNGDGLIHLLDFERRSPVVRLHGHLARVTGLRFSPDGSTLYSCSHDGTMRVWDTAVVPLVD